MIPSVLMSQPAGVPVQVYPSPPLALADVPKLTVQELAGLPAIELARLQREAESGLQKAKALVAWLDGALSIRYKDRARQARAEAQKDAGTVRFEDNGVTVVADLPKKVEWDQHELSELVERIKADGENPRDYVEVSFRVSERKYTAWPKQIARIFEPARTVRSGKETFELLAGEVA
jgi:hypothetical protein